MKLRFYLLNYPGIYDISIIMWMYVCKNWTYTLDTVDLYYTNLINTYSIFLYKIYR